VESRRFRAYEASRHRVHLIERSFYREVLGEGSPDPRWTDQLLEALEQPGLTVNSLGALGWRLRRNYVWIITAVLVTWLGKLYLSGEPAASPEQLLARAVIGPIPGWLVASVVLLCYAIVVAIAVGARRIFPLGDDEARQMMEHVSDE
jgi:uncharacterized membrane protein